MGPQPRDFSAVRVAIILNHTSLFEPLFVGVAPFSWLWAVARRGLLPGADSTLDRPLAGRFFKALAPEVVPVTRARDKSWRDFIAKMTPRSIVILAPEGRMKRRDGLDRHGQPMTVRGGIADILERVDSGGLLIVYSGGLHHVQAPGDRWPRLFQRVRVRLQVVPIAAYKEEQRAAEPGFRERVMADLERRRDAHCRWA